MPLRDHFRPPISEYRHWEGFHGMLPAIIVLKLVPLLPPGFAAEPRVRLGTNYEVDVGAFEDGMPGGSDYGDNGGGTATLVQATLAPTWTTETEIADLAEYEVLVYDEREIRNLVAAIEIVSPRNKDRPESRQAFAAKTANLLRDGVCVSIVDLVTLRNFNLYAQMMYLCAQKDPTLGTNPPTIYASTARARSAHRPNLQRKILDTWFYRLAVGQPLPTLPVWLDEDIQVTLNLEESYEETCRVLAIR